MDSWGPHRDHRQHAVAANGYGNLWMSRMAVMSAVDFAEAPVGSVLIVGETPRYGGIYPAFKVGHNSWEIGPFSYTDYGMWGWTENFLSQGGPVWMS